MNPLVLSTLFGLGADLVDTVGDVVGASSIFSRADRDRLEELRRLQAQSQLGLTDRETQQLQRNLLNPLQAEQAARTQQQRQMLAGQNAGAAAAAMLNQQQDDDLAKLRQMASEEVQRQSLATAQAQEEEIRTLKKLRDQERAQVVGALTGGLAGVSRSLGGTIGETLTQQKQQQAHLEEDFQGLEGYRNYFENLYRSH